MYVNKFCFEDKRRTSPVSAVPPPHRKHAVLVVWLVFRKTKDINIEHMLGVELREIEVELGIDFFNFFF